MHDTVVLSDESKARMLTWVHALESDEYTQTTGLLEVRETEDGPAKNCCLGVLCRVAMAQGLDVEVSQTKIVRNNGTMGVVTRFDGSMSALPLTVLGWLLGHSSPTNYGLLLDQTRLITMNDERGEDFHQIAVHLRQTYGIDG